MSLVTLFSRRLPPPCWLRAYQTTSVKLCNPKGATAPPMPLGSEPKEPVTEQSQKPLKEDKNNIQKYYAPNWLSTLCIAMLHPHSWMTVIQ